MEFNEGFEELLAGMTKKQAQAEIKECMQDIKEYEKEIVTVTEFIEYVKQKFNI